jgi:hypothetical protein
MLSVLILFPGEPRPPMGRMRSRFDFQASSLRQSDLIFVEDEQAPRFEMDCPRKMKDIQRSLSSGHCVP